jgi:beta-lactamase class A
MRRLPLVALALALTLGTARADGLRSADPAALDRATAVMDPAKTSVAVIDLSLPVDALHGHGMDAVVSPASVIKLSVLVTVYKVAATDPGLLDRSVAIAAANMTDTWLPPGDTRPLLHAGDTRTVRELCDLMITRSDNVATNQLVDVVDRNVINATMIALGFDGIVFRHKLGGATIIADPQATGFNSMRAGSTAKLLAGIARRTLVSAAASDAMEKHLLGQLDTGFIKAGLPSEVALAWKSGATSTVSAAAGIARGPGRAYVLVAFTPYTEAAAAAPMKNLAAAVDACFTGSGAWPIHHAWTDSVSATDSAGRTFATAFQAAVAKDLASRDGTLSPTQLPIHVVTRFAIDNGLEVRLSIGGAAVSSKDFASLAAFVAVVDKATPADLLASSSPTGSPAGGDFVIAGSSVTELSAPGPASARRFSFLPDTGAPAPVRTPGITGDLPH